MSSCARFRSDATVANKSARRRHDNAPSKRQSYTDGASTAASKQRRYGNRASAAPSKSKNPSASSLSGNSAGAGYPGAISLR